MLLAIIPEVLLGKDKEELVFVRKRYNLDLETSISTQ
jgi:hypothetical protein